MKRAILISTLFIGLLTASYITILVINKKSVTVPIDSPGLIVAIYKDGKKIKEISETTKLHLWKGAYAYGVFGKNYDSRATSFIVSENMSLKIEKKYLKEYTDRYAIEHRSEIEQILFEKYPSTGEITITDLSVDKSLSWAYGKLTTKESPSTLYRFILKNESGWVPVIDPTIAISIKNTRNVPRSIVYGLY